MTALNLDSGGIADVKGAYELETSDRPLNLEAHLGFVAGIIRG